MFHCFQSKFSIESLSFNFDSDLNYERWKLQNYLHVTYWLMYLFILQILRRKKKRLNVRAHSKSATSFDHAQWWTRCSHSPTPRVDNKSQWTVTNLNMKRLLSQLFNRTLKDPITWKIFLDETDRESENTVY